MGTSFDAIYNRLEPHIDAFESKRRALFSKGLRNGAITAGIIILVSLFFIQSLGFFLWIIIGLAIIIGITILNSQSGELCAYYKTHIVPPILNEVVPNVHYEPGMGISEETFCTCKLFPPPDRYSSEDFISGRVDKTDICFSEVHAEERHVSTTKNGTREYWKEIFWPDVPTWLKVPVPFMPVIELFGIFTKPFALTVRLFANIMAGHAIILSLVSIIFITASLGVVLNTSMTIISVLFSVFMSCLEVLVAFIQAYVFTMLSAVFIGLAQVHHEHK